MPSNMIPDKKSSSGLRIKDAEGVVHYFEETRGLEPAIPSDYWMNQQKQQFQNTENDPYGKSQHEPGAKLDAGKQRPALVLGSFSRALAAVVQIGTFGANKYTPRGWETVPNGIERYADAAGRHRLKRGMGEELDPDSKMKHLAHEAWNVLAELELLLREEEKYGKTTGGA